MIKPLVSIAIPTLNSEKTLRRTLDSIKTQTYKNFEIIIIDNGSKDKTLEIAKEFKVRIFHNKGKLLGSRYIGVTQSKGDIHFFIDSDQVLASNLLKKVVDEIGKSQFDMFFLEEDSYRPRTIIEKLTSLDRKIYHQKMVVDPSESVLLPRAFKIAVLRKAFSRVDKKLFDVVTLQDHAIIYYECYKITKKIGYIKDAIYHNEPKNVSDLFMHYFEWGIKVQEKSHDLPEEYRMVFSKKVNNRKKSIDFLSLNFILVSPVLMIKALGYYLGLFYAKYLKS